MDNRGDGNSSKAAFMPKAVTIDDDESISIIAGTHLSHRPGACGHKVGFDGFLNAKCAAAPDEQITDDLTSRTDRSIWQRSFLIAQQLTFFTAFFVLDFLTKRRNRVIVFFCPERDRSRPKNIT